MMEQVTIDIATPNAEGGHTAVDAWLVAPGLAIHEALGDELARAFSPWTITHTPTGRFLASAYTKDKARQIVLAIKDLADWPSITPENVPPGLQHKVHLIAQRISPPRRVM